MRALAAAGLVLWMTTLPSESAAVPTRIDFTGQATTPGFFDVGASVTGFAIFDPDQLPLLPANQIGGLIRLQDGSRTLEVQLYNRSIGIDDQPAGSAGFDRWNLDGDNSWFFQYGFYYVDILLDDSTATRLTSSDVFVPTTLDGFTRTEIAISRSN